MRETLPLPDRGAQSERTMLAWTRTAVGLVAVAALQLRLTVTDRDLPATVVTLLVVASGAALYAAGRRRYRTLRRAVAAERVVAARTLPVTATAAVVLLSVAGVVTIVR